ncbi:hypothetical protein ACIA5D_25485 [Actinoplanes sp. NPDC051513]|uniref:hypothetical protein n=1 Tax=Actinoplanes sp. NPDC051513 TaxID=3363908 RepID=UPI003799C4F3
MTEATSVPPGRWTHSHEEDHDGVEVYRPAGYDFPPARGRSGIEFRPDGTYIDWAIGRGDANEARPGRWEPAAAGGLRIITAGEQRVLVVALVAPDRLEIRPGGPR